MERNEWAMRTRREAPHDPAPLRRQFGDVRYASIWLAPRIVLGWLSLQAGWSWLRELMSPIGTLTVAEPGPSNMLAIGLTVSGIFLILGALTGPAAFVAGCCSVRLWGAESSGVATLHFALVVWLILTWRSAGRIGFDRWLLPLLGLPFQGSGLVSGDANEDRQ